MKLGGLNIADVKIGDTQVDKVYQGGNLVWQYVPPTPLLDDYPNAAAAYSLRLLRSAYTGSAIRVRRASDNTEQDIAFVNNELDTSALTTFCSGTDGFVKTWYDQSGNSKDATQTTLILQPKIVSAGNILTEKQKPSIIFDSNTKTFLNAGNFSNLTEAELFLTVKSYSDGPQGRNEFIDFGNHGSSVHYPFSNGIIYDGFGSNQRKTTVDPIESLRQLHIYGVTTKLNLWQSRINTISHFTTTSNTVGFKTSCQIGSDVTSFYFIGSISELILYPSDKSLLRDAINTNINDFYSIY